jgi:putative hydrolase of the HAD superfamily
MKIKAALIDLDDTICNTKPLYSEALPHCLEVFKQYTGTELSLSEFTDKYNKAKKEVKTFVPGSAAQHNRAIYFQRLVEQYNCSTDYELVYQLYETYYNYIYDNIVLFPHAEEFLKWISESGRKIIIVSNGNAHVRIKKIHALGITKYIDYMVSSEESGIGKPAGQPYLLALNKARLHPEEVVMVGNDPKGDIYGAKRVGIITIQTQINNDPNDNPVSDDEKAKYIIKDLSKVKDIIQFIEDN